MTTPAQNIDTLTSHVNRGDRSNGTTVSQSLFISKVVQKRPQSVGGARVDGLYPLKGFSNEWCELNLIPSSFRATVKSYPSDYFDWKDSSFFDAATIWERLLALHPFLKGGMFDVQLDSATRVKFFKELAGQRWELGTSLAEARETVGYLRQLASRIHKTSRGMARKAGIATENLYSAMKHMGDRRHNSALDAGYAAWAAAQKKSASSRYGTKTVDRLAGSWLEYQFGVTPLLRDLADAATYYDKLLTKMSGNQRLRLSVTESTGVEQHSLSFNTAGGYLFNTGEVRYQLESVATIVGDYVLVDEVARTNEELALNNQLAMGWEVIPFSWLADYVVDVGGWLGQLTAPAGLRPLGASISRTTRIRVTELIPMENQVFTYSGLSRQKFAGEAKVGRFTRSIEPLVAPAVIPPLGSMLGVKQALNVLAVAMQAIGRR